MADDHLAKKHHRPRKETKLRDKGRIWRKRKKLEVDKIEKIDKIWNLDFVSLNRPDTC